MENVIWVSSTVVEEVCQGSKSGLSAMGLLGAEHANGGEHGGINGTAIGECAKDLLNIFGISGVQRRGCVWAWHELSFCSIMGFLPGMGRVLFACLGGMLEALEGAFDVARHGYNADMVCIIPGESEATIFCAFPILANCIGFVQCSQEVL